MNTKNIILFSIATTLLFASGVEGMKKIQKKDNEIRIFLPKHKNTCLQKLDDKKQSCDVSIIALASGQYSELEGLMFELFKKISKNKQRLTKLIVEHSKNIAKPETRFWIKIFGHLKAFQFSDSPLPTEMVEQILLHNPKLKCLDLSGNDKTSWKKISWDNASNLKLLRLSRTNIKIETIKTILLKCPNLIEVVFAECKNIDPQDIELTKLKEQYPDVTFVFTGTAPVSKIISRNRSYIPLLEKLEELKYTD